MAGPHCESLNGMASLIDLSPLPTNTASFATPMSLFILVLPDVSVSLV